MPDLDAWYDAYNALFLKLPELTGEELANIVIDTDALKSAATRLLAKRICERTAQVVSTEAALAANPAVTAQIERAITDPSSRTRSGRPTRVALPEAGPDLRAQIERDEWLADRPTRKD